MAFRPDVTVASVIERDGRFLLIEEQVSGKLVFNQPAGHLEAGETLIEAAIRETLEESAWHFLPERVVGLYLWRHPASGKGYLRVAFCGQATGHEANRPLDTGIERAVWLTRREIQQREPRLRSPLVLRVIDDYLAGCRYPLGLIAHLGISDSGEPLELRTG